MRRPIWCYALAFAVVGCFLLLAPANALAAGPTPPFAECPAIGADLSCGVLVVIDDKGRVTGYYDPSQGPYDGGDDTLVGIINKSHAIVTSVPLSGPDIFGFDGDGLCTYIMCTWPNPTGYEGSKNTFTVTDASDGFVNFTGGLAPGASTYFSLEGSTPFVPWIVVHPSNLDHSDVTPNTDHGGLDFGNLESGLMHEQTLTITNGGNTPLQISSATIPGSVFKVAMGPSTTCVNASGTVVSVDPEDSCTIEVSFAATHLGLVEEDAELTMTDNAPDSPQTISLRGTTTFHNLLDGQVGEEQATHYPLTSPCKAHTVILGKMVGWGLLAYLPETLEGQVVEGHIATEDATHVPVLGPDSLHFAADYNFFVYPDQGYRKLLKPGNFKVTGEYTPSEVGRIEVEWERAGHGHDGLPEWAWPTVGDKIKVVGWHILDCGHGKPDYRSEIHPPLFVATYRNAALAPLGGWSGRLGSSDPSDDHEATHVDVFASSYGGGAFGIEFGHAGLTHQPVSLYTYTFDVMAPPQPSATAVLAPPDVKHMQGAPGPLTWTLTPDGRGYSFTLKFPPSAGKIVSAGGASEVFGARISVRWTDKNAPAIKNLHIFKVQPLSLHVIENLATVGSAPWGLYAYVNEEQRGSLLFGGGLNSNHESYMDVHNKDHIDLSSTAPFEVTVVDNQPLHISFRVTYFNASRFLCTSCGGGDSAGTASQFYDPSLLLATQDITLTGSADLAGHLGKDEWSSGCPCFDIKFKITKVK